LSLSLFRSAPAFGSNAHRGRWDDRDVLAYLGPTVEGAVASSRQRATSFLNRQAAGMWPLLGVESFEGRAAWLYPSHDGLSAAALVVRPPPMRVCLELARHVLRVLRALAAAGTPHPGPLPEDVLLSPNGQVHLTGFVGPSSTAPNRAAPGSVESDDAALAYRFGVFACELLGSTVPVHGKHDDEQRKLQRRVAIRIMSRPGPVLDEGARNELIRCLSFEPEARPSLDGVDAALTRGAEVLLRQADLVTWTRKGVPEGLALTHASARSTLELPARDLLTDAGEGEDGFTDDDVTAVSAGSTPGTYRRLEFGSIPVTVGPPPEVARMRPSIPPDLFDEDPTIPEEAGIVAPVVEMPRQGIEPRTVGFVIVCLVLGAVATTLALYLF